MKILVYIFLITLNIFPIYSQNRIESIRKYYGVINTIIEQNISENKPCFHEIILNETVPGTGPSKSIIKIFYTDSLNEYGIPDHKAVKITKANNIAAMEFVTEFLIKDNQVVFIYYNSKFDKEEQRYYFDNERLIKTIFSSAGAKSVERINDFDDFTLNKSSFLLLDVKKYLKIFELFYTGD